MEGSTEVPGDRVYVAVHPYDGQRDDIISFSKGQLMVVSERPSDTWWVAELNSGQAGYVPAAYLKELSLSEDTGMIGSPPPIRSPPLQRCARHRTTAKLATPEALRWVSGNPVAVPRVEQQDWEAVDLAEQDPAAQEIKREAMSQLMIRVRGHLGEETVRKPLEEVLTPPQLEDVHQIESRKLTNPVLESTQHKQLQQELKLRNKRGELRNERSELDRILSVRKRETDSCLRRAASMGSPGDIKSPHGSMSAELYQQLHKRTLHLQQVEEDLTADKLKPEFLKIKLRKAPTS